MLILVFSVVAVQAAICKIECKEEVWGAEGRRGKGSKNSVTLQANEPGFAWICQDLQEESSDRRCKPQSPLILPINTASLNIFQLIHAAFPCMFPRNNFPLLYPPDV